MPNQIRMKVIVLTHRGCFFVRLLVVVSAVWSKVTVYTEPGLVKDETGPEACGFKWPSEPMWNINTNSDRCWIRGTKWQQSIRAAVRENIMEDKVEIFWEKAILWKSSGSFEKKSHNYENNLIILWECISRILLENINIY